MTGIPKIWSEKELVGGFDRGADACGHQHNNEYLADDGGDRETHGGQSLGSRL
jgi:hypothetical protein